MRDYKILEKKMTIDEVYNYLKKNPQWRLPRGFVFQDRLDVHFIEQPDILEQKTTRVYIVDYRNKQSTVNRLNKMKILLVRNEDYEEIIVKKDTWFNRFIACWFKRDDNFEPKTYITPEITSFDIKKMQEAIMNYETVYDKWICKSITGDKEIELVIRLEGEKDE